MLHSYQESIDWLFEQFPAYQKIGESAYKPDLDNILSLCSTLSIEFSHLKFIHVAGTNGKGSVSNFTASILQESGYKTGLFTSPHIVDFRERIRINGIEIPAETVVAFCQNIQTLELAIAPSFFEITWALALQHFSQNACEICVIETGLGGRLDATNIIHPILSIITNIGLDHVNILGDTLEKIAVEKAGIIKNRVPIIIGETQSATTEVFVQKAQASHAEIIFSDQLATDYTSHFANETYQATNEKTVRTAIKQLSRLGFTISATSIKQGLKHVAQNTGFRARFQQIASTPLTIIDVAHNVEGITVLLNSMKAVQQGRLMVVYGTSSDKDATKILSLFPANTEFFFTEFANLRSATTQQLKEYATNLNLNAKFYPTIKAAYAAAQLSANKENTILITGSFFLLNDFF